MIIQGDARHIPLGDETVQCVVTSPPYWGLRDYGLGSDALGLEPTIELYVEHLVEIFREVKRVLRKDGTVWLNIGDSYTSGNRPTRDPSLVSATSGLTNRSAGLARPGTPPGLKPKDLCMIPARVALALQADGWWVRSDIIWAKRNCMPESVTDRPTKSHEHVFLLTKSKRYFYDADAIREPVQANNTPIGREHAAGIASKRHEKRQLAGKKVGGHSFGVAYCNPAGRNKRDVWFLATTPFKEAHFATFPPALAETCIKAGTSEKGACPICGAQWERVVRRDADYPDDHGNMGAKGSKWASQDEQSSGHRIQKNMNAMRAKGRDHDNPFPRKVTIGWRPTCSCGGDPVPCIVLDPFSGAATSGLVASRLGRRYVGIEMNMDYCKMGRKRIIDDCPMFAGL